MGFQSLWSLWFPTAGTNAWLVREDTFQVREGYLEQAVRSRGPGCLSRLPGRGSSSPRVIKGVIEQTEHGGWIPAARFKVTLVREEEDRHRT